VWCSKYRRSVLDGPVADRLREVVGSVAQEVGLIVLALEVMPEHVCLLVEGDPRWVVAGIVDRFKGVSSRTVRREFWHLRSWLSTMWSRCCYAGLVGRVSDATVRRYMAAQKGV
jgi:putative transposase